MDSTLFYGCKLIDDISLIKIHTIKSKFLDQIDISWPETILNFNDIEIVGRTENFVLFMYNDVIYKMNFRVFADKLHNHIISISSSEEGRAESEITRIRLKHAIQTIPKIFIS